MHNPYTLLTPALLEALLRQPLYFVRQSYPRGQDPRRPDLLPLLLTHYGHHETDRERTERHLRLLNRDACRFLYDSQYEEHRQRLEQAARQPDGCRVYINLLPHAWTPPLPLKQRIRDFVQEQWPGDSKKGNEKLRVTLKERYGELFVALGWKGHQMEVHLDVLDPPGLCVTT